MRQKAIFVFGLYILIGFSAFAQQEHPLPECIYVSQLEANDFGRAFAAFLDLIKWKPSESKRLTDLHTSVVNVVSAKKNWIGTLENCLNAQRCSENEWKTTSDAVGDQLENLRRELKAIGDEMRDAPSDKQQELTNLYQAVDDKMIHLRCAVPSDVSKFDQKGLNSLKCDVRKIESANCKLVESSAAKGACTLSYDSSVCVTGSNPQ